MYHAVLVSPLDEGIRVVEPMAKTRHPSGARPHSNPFRVSRLDRLCYVPTGPGAAALLDRLAALGGRGAIVGPHGSGKSTLLKRLEELLQERGHPAVRVCLNEDTGAAPAWRLGSAQACGRFVLLDGAEQLGPLAWRWFRRRTRGAAGLIITRHTPGRLPCLHTSQASTAVLDEVLSQLCGSATSDWKPLAHSYFEEASGNLHTVLLRLYDAAARASQVRSPDP